MNRSRAWLLAAASLAAGGGAVAQSLPTVESGQDGLFDKVDKTAIQHFTYKDHAVPQGIPATVTCFYYPAFTVKDLELGDEGAAAISVTPARGAVRPTCGAQDDPGEMVLPDARGMTYVGAKGAFVSVSATEGPGFTIYSATTGKQVYRDATKEGDLKSISANGAILTLHYIRNVAAPCSLVSDPQPCWARTAKEGHLASAIASQPPPVALCRAAYAKQGFPPADPNQWSSFGYEVTVEINQNGTSRVINRGAITVCYPEP